MSCSASLVGTRFGVVALLDVNVRFHTVWNENIFIDDTFGIYCYRVQTVTHYVILHIRQM